MKKGVLTGIVIAFGLLFLMPFAQAEKNPSPYGDYKKDSANSGYGEKKPVNTIEEAKKVLNNFFKGKKIQIGEIREKDLFFEAEIKDRNNNIIDKVIIDKRTGRIRSIY
ncbi:MAG: hypothetical protein AB1632_11060 [Nitrospirota bacterium]